MSEMMNFCKSLEAASRAESVHGLNEHYEKIWDNVQESMRFHPHEKFVMANPVAILLMEIQRLHERIDHLEKRLKTSAKPVKVSPKPKLVDAVTSSYADSL